MSEDMVVGTGIVELEARLVTSLRQALKAFVISLLSRKLWLALGSAFALYQAKRYLEAVGIVAAYLGVEGAADIGERVQRAKPLPPIVEHSENTVVESQTPAPKTTRRRAKVG